MGLDASIYQNIKPVEMPSYVDAQAKTMSLSQMAMQQAKMQKDMTNSDRDEAYKAHLQKAKAFGEGLDSLNGVKPEQRPAAYAQVRNELIKSGISTPDLLPEQEDIGLTKQYLNRYYKSTEHIENSLKKSQIAENYAHAASFNADAGRKGLSEGQKAVDKDYAKSYNSLTQKGAVNAKSAIDRLEALTTEIEGDIGPFESGGGRVSALPDALRSRDAIRRRDQAKNFANTSLKELFGGQLSDAEREAAAKEYYNDALSNEDNAKILRGKIAQLRDAYDTETEKAKYYEAKGTLKGFTGMPNENIADSKQVPSNKPSGMSLGTTSANASDQPIQKLPAPPEGMIRVRVKGGATKIIEAKHKGEAIAAGASVVD